MRLYIDTNVYLDYFLEREKSRYAFNIFKKSINCQFHIILSDQVLLELSRIIEYSDTVFLFETLKKKLILITLTDADIEKAKLLPTHYADALHIVLAEKAGADVIVTSNLKDFSSIFKAESPENF